MSGYRKGMYVQLAEKNGFPKGVSCKVNVNDSFKNNDSVYLYSYDRNNKVVELAEKALKVQDGAITFSTKTLSSYFLTKALIEKSTSGGSDIYKTVAAIEFIALFFVVCILIILKGKKQKKDVVATPQPSEAVNKTPEVANQNTPLV